MENITSLDKKNIQYIRAKESGWDYCFEGIKNMGYNIMIPYRDKNIVLRLMREAWFRLKLPYRQLWYNPGIKRIKAQNIIIKDPLITKDFVEYLRKIYPDKRIILEYDNRVKNSIKTGMNPKSLKPGTADLWSYDMDDCIEYGMNKKRDFYLDIYRTTKADLGDMSDILEYNTSSGCCATTFPSPGRASTHFVCRYIPSRGRLNMKKYDILYLGRDKGRAGEILKYRKYFKSLGLKTYFHICADRSMFAKKKSYYKPKIKYTEYLKLQQQSRAILNIMPEGQYSITPRDMEAAFNNVKEITNNKGVKNLEFYSPDRYFILGEDNIKDIKEFLNKPLSPISEEILKKYTFDNMVKAMLLSHPLEES